MGAVRSIAHNFPIHSGERAVDDRALLAKLGTGRLSGDALAREFGIPIRFAGIGERPEDLRVFDPEAFVDALLPEALGS
ncbi:MAG TPA: hypothetical protein DDZ67_01505 [Xanthomonadaceae bacterium]|nr:hypothetical protein [Xanthomonadaceae bacterium]